jgi:hypothetical protein
MISYISKEEYMKKYGHVDVKLFSYDYRQFSFIGRLNDYSTLVVFVDATDEVLSNLSVHANESVSIDSLNPDSGTSVLNGVVKELF